MAIYIVYEADGDYSDFQNETINTAKIVPIYFTDKQRATECAIYYTEKRDEVWESVFRVAELKQDDGLIDYVTIHHSIVVQKMEAAKRQGELQKQRDLEKLAELKARYES